ncbi:metallophosphoesterase [Arthrobacter sp. 35W]|uniref:metallophosphoesterase n=1 Tax=Arthrobacter sp. 35W TaxID=1132441 RepID=UPI0004174EB7|nr:metallophosphoesterase [Arthrobacter sp. 35W]
MIPVDALRILHLSDTHLLGGGGRHSGVVDTVSAYAGALARFDAIGPLDLVVVSGDVSDDGSESSYRTVRGLTEAFAGRHGAVAVYAMGNHDEPEGFRAVLGCGHPERAQPYASGGSPGAIAGISVVRGWRVVTLDSSVPGRTHGHLDAAQLDWLRAMLAVDAPHGTVVVVHHPPVPPATPLHQGIGLLNPGALAAALAGTDAAVVLSGHYHHHLVDSFDAGGRQVPVVVAAGIVNHNDLLAPPGHERAADGGGAVLLELHPLAPAVRGGARLRILPVPPPPGPAHFDLSPDAVADIAARIAATPAERAAAVHSP